MKIDIQINNKPINKKRINNILYTLLCVCFLIFLLLISVYGLIGLKSENVINDIEKWHLIVIDLIILSIGYKLFNSKNYA